MKADGTVSFNEATVGASLAAAGAVIDDASGYAFSASHATIGGDAVLGDGFSTREGTDLDAIEVRGNLNLSGGSFHASKRSGLPAVDLTQAHVDGILSLVNAAIDGALVLNYAKVGVLADDVSSWPLPGYLYLDGFVYGEISPTSPLDASSRIRWLALQGGRFRSQPYEQVARTLRSTGDSWGAARVLMAMQDAASKQAGRSPSQICWDWILWLTIGYGYDPWRELWFILGLVTFGAVVFGWGSRRGLLIRADPGTPMGLPFSSVVYSLETCLPLVDLGQAKHWTPNDEGSRGARFLRTYRWLHILLGWFLASMLVAAIAGLVRHP